MYAIATYALFIAVLVYAIGFFADLAVPKGIDGGPAAPTPLAVAIDLLLLLLFAVQHTVMARGWFKRRWTRVVPAAAERATFVLAATAVLALVFWQWRPLPSVVWSLSGPPAALLLAVYAGGWALAVASTLAIDHLDLFGVRQAYLFARGADYRPVPFTERGLYRLVRHPLMTGFLLVFWAAPTMTVGRLLFAVGATGYIVAGIAFEEHDLRAAFGDAYRSYAERVPALIPLPRSAGRRARERA
jgi:protein-S-isoprenylcysteine O-methyltransferase Ste14